MRREGTGAGGAARRGRRVAVSKRFASRNRRGRRAGEVACSVAARAATPPASPLSPLLPKRPHCPSARISSQLLTCSHRIPRRPLHRPALRALAPIASVVRVIPPVARALVSPLSRACPRACTARALASSALSVPQLCPHRSPLRLRCPSHRLSACPASPLPRVARIAARAVSALPARVARVGSPIAHALASLVQNRQFYAAERLLCTKLTFLYGLLAC